MSKKLNDASIATITTLDDTDYLNPVVASTGEIQKITVADFKDSLDIPTGAQVYAARISQSGSSAPTETFVCENTTGVTFTWGRTTNGTYTVTASESFFNGTVIITTNPNVGAFGFIIQHDFTSSTILTLYVRSFAGSFVDDALDNACIKIEKY